MLKHRKGPSRNRKLNFDGWKKASMQLIMWILKPLCWTVISEALLYGLCLFFMIAIQQKFDPSNTFSSTISIVLFRLVVLNGIITRTIS